MLPCINALSGWGFISTVPLRKPRFYAVSGTCFCRYLSEYSNNDHFSCMLTIWTYLIVTITTWIFFSITLFLHFVFRYFYIFPITNSLMLQFMRYAMKALRCNGFVDGPVSLQLTGHPFAKPHVPCVVANRKQVCEQLCFVHERASTSSCWSVKFLCKHEICPDLAYPWTVTSNC